MWPCLAARHPDASFVCLHTGADWERGIRRIRATNNVCSEVSGSDPTAGLVEMAVRELGAERVIFGSDAAGRSFASQLAKVYSADLPAEARQLILGGNLRRLLQRCPPRERQFRHDHRRQRECLALALPTHTLRRTAES